MGNSVSIKIEPSKPAINNPFSVQFKIETSSNESINISFDYKGFEVLSQKKKSDLIKSVFLKNKTVSKREVIYIYQFLPKKSGIFYLRNIKIRLGQQIIKHKKVTIEILLKKPALKDIFLKAEVSKSDIFLGEGVDVRYYLYSKVPIYNYEVKKFPFLNKMIKRFHNIRGNFTNVVYEGAIYRKSLKYSARVYPEEVGTVYVDPLHLKIQYQKSSRRNPLRRNFGRLVEKSIYSPKVSITVKPLPTNDIPPRFTGLVGEHEFQIVQQKINYLVNEAIKLKVKINGPGSFGKNGKSHFL